MVSVIDTGDAPETPVKGRWRGPALEALVAVVAASLFLASCVFIKVRPTDRLGQISGLASLAFRFVLFGIVLVLALVIARRVREGRGFATTIRLVCAATAGIATGMVAGGIMVALHGTPWGLNGRGGDVGVLATWAAGLHRGESFPPMYPPLAVHVLHLYSDVMNLEPDLAIKHLQILGTAAFGPVAYMSWRLLLRPGWALGIGVVAMVPLIDPYKPFPNLVLVIFLPLAILFLKVLREIPDRTNIQIVRAGTGFGLAFGILCLTYSGWYQWSIPGLFVAAMVVFPWKDRRKGIALLAITAIVFLVVTGHYLSGLLFDPAGKIADKYVYFDVKTDPMYIAMWRNDTPGPVGAWPPIGELGGVGLFTIILAIGFGMAVALGRKTTLVIGTASVMVGAWVFRLFYARQLYDTKLVQLYPRTTPLILYCLLVLTGFAAYWLVERAPPESPFRKPSGLIGGLCALLLLFGSTGTATVDRYMPADTDPPSAGFLALNAHRTNWAFRTPVYKSRPMPWVRRSITPDDRVDQH